MIVDRKEYQRKPEVIDVNLGRQESVSEGKGSKKTPK